MASKTSRWDSLLEKSVVGSFTSLGHTIRSRSWDTLSDDSLADRVLILTGATSGIGRTVALESARRGARVRFVARNVAKARALREELVATANHDDFRFYIADLSKMSEVDKVSKSILRAEPFVHVLINNAVVLPDEYAETEDGLELSHATNLVAPFLLTNQLKGRLVESAPAHIINVISGGMYTQGLALDDLNNRDGDYSGSVAYARAKRGLMVLTKMWADQLAGTGVTVNATHPGWVNTPGIKDALPAFYRITRPVLRTPEQGADTILWLAADGPEGQTGGLWHDRKARTEYRLKRTIESTADRNRLWAQLTTTTEGVVAENRHE